LPFIWDGSIQTDDPRALHFLDRAAAAGVGSGLALYFINDAYAVMVSLNRPERMLTSPRRRMIEARMGDALHFASVFHWLFMRRVIMRGLQPLHQDAPLSPRELEFFTGYVENPVVQEYLEGPEFTIDVMCDVEGRPLSIVPRERVVIRAGVIDRGRTVRNQKLIDLAQLACEAIPFAGPINIQCRMRGDEPVIFEINPRFSGGIPLTIQSGADFPRMLVRMAMGGRVEPAIGQFREELWMTSFESSFFLEAAEVAMPSLDQRISEVA